MSEAQNKPVAIETRRDLLFAASKRRSMRSILIMAILAFVFGLLVSFVARGFVDIGGEDGRSDQTGSGLLLRTGSTDRLV